MTHQADLLASISTETKYDLALCAHQFFASEWDPQSDDEDQNFILGVAWALATDTDSSVRRKLAEQLASCRQLPQDLAEEIASDVQSVAVPFLMETEAFSDKQLANLIAFLKEFAVSTVAKRPDIGKQTVYAIAVSGNAQSVTFLLLNKHALLGHNAARKIYERFRDNQYLMDLLACRLGLPDDVVEAIIDIVSSFARSQLVKNYHIKNNVVAVQLDIRSTDWILKQVEKADAAQIHSMVILMRQRKELYHLQALEVAEKGCFEFLESMLAVEAGETLGYVREVLTLRDSKAFVALLQKAGVKRNSGPKFLHVVKQRNRQKQKA